MFGSINNDMNFKQFYSNLSHKVYCDMDGVLADFQGYAETHIPNYSKQSKVELPIGMFSKLKVLTGAHKLIRHLKPIFGSNLYILTAVPKNSNDPNVAQDKIDWMQRHFGIPKERVFVVYREDKQNFTEHNKNNILIDDRKDNVREWNAAGGTGILYKNVDACIKQLQDIIAR